MSAVTSSEHAIEVGVISRRASRERADEHYADWCEPPALTLDESGVIQDCNRPCEMLFGARCINLVGRHVSSLFSELLDVALVQQGRLNPVLNYNCHCGQLFHAQSRQGHAFSSKLYFVHLANDGRPSLRLIVRPLGAMAA